VRRWKGLAANETDSLKDAGKAPFSLASASSRRDNLRHWDNRFGQRCAMGPTLRLKLPVKNAQDIQRLLNALGTLNAVTSTLSTGGAFRNRLAKKTDEELTEFVHAARLLSKVLEPLWRTPIEVEAEIAEP
jgi:hypothetical protein